MINSLRIKYLLSWALCVSEGLFDSGRRGVRGWTEALESVCIFETVCMRRKESLFES